MTLVEQHRRPDLAILWLWLLEVTAPSEHAFVHMAFREAASVARSARALRAFSVVMARMARENRAAWLNARRTLDSGRDSPKRDHPSCQ